MWDCCTLGIAATAWKIKRETLEWLQMEMFNSNNNNNVPPIIGALGTIKKTSDQKLHLLPGHLSAIELQNITRSALHTLFVKCWSKSL